MQRRYNLAHLILASAVVALESDTVDGMPLTHRHGLPSCLIGIGTGKSM